MTISSLTSKPTVGSKLRALANKLNDGNKLGICSLLLVAGLAVTLAVMSQDVSREKAEEIREDYRAHLKQRALVQIKKDKAEVNPENHAAYDLIAEKSVDVKGKSVVFALVHSINPEGETPHAIMIASGNSDTPTMLMVPQDICTDEGWAAILKATPVPEFGTKWGYKIPDALGVETKPGSENAIEAPKEDPTKTVILATAMPVERTVTDTKGRSIEGTILAKTATTISFQRKGTNAPVDIKLDILSPEDQAFVETLVDKANKKASVLLVLGPDTQAEDYERAKPLRDWIQGKGFDVVLAVSGNDQTILESKKARCKIPAGEPTILINPLTALDQFDVVWIERFATSGDKESNHFAVVRNRDANKGLLVIPTREDMTQKTRFLTKEEYYRRSTLASAKSERDIPFVRTNDNIIFYSRKYPVEKDVKGGENVLKRIDQLLK